MKAYWIFTPDRIIFYKKPNLDDPPVKQPTQLPLLYEVEVIQESCENLPSRSEIRVVRQIWKSPEIKEWGLDFSSSNCSTFRFRNDIFYSRDDAIQEHQKRCKEYLHYLERKLQQQKAALANYNDILNDEKYISPFTGEIK